ncbi:Permease of the drug/metabolite transporter (DMT) superfamily, partial [Durusdinium trenchii]
MFAFPIALLLAIDRFSWRRLAGLLCGLSGVAFLALPGSSLPQAGLLVFLPLAMIAPLFYSLEGNIVAKWGTAGLSPVQLVLGANLIGMVIAAPLAVGTGQWVDPFPPYGAPDVAIVALAAIHALVYVSYVWLVGQAGAVFAAQVSYLVTGFGVFWAMLILGERYSGFFWAAMALMIFADAQAFGALAIVVVMFVLFVREAYPTEVVALAGVSVLLLTGILPYHRALDVLSNPAPWTIGAMFIVMGALVRTGALDAFIQLTRPLSASRPKLAIFVLLIFVALASAVVSNTPVVVVMIP